MLSNKLVCVASSKDLLLGREGGGWYCVMRLWFCNNYKSSRKIETLILLIRWKKS